jgi:hypothetical protein
MSANPLVDAAGLGDVEIIIRQAIVDPPSMATTVDATVSATVTDVEIGDFVMPIAPYDLQSMIVNAGPSASNTVDVNFYNASAGTVDLASGTWTFIILKPGQI